MMIRACVFAALLALLPLGAEAANCNSNPFTLTNGQTADATQVMANFNNLLNCSNNNLAHNGANSDITSLSGLTTPLSVPQGGTGAATFATAGVLVGNTTSPIQVVAPSTAGNLLVSTGAAWSSSKALSGSYTIGGVTLTGGQLTVGGGPLAMGSATFNETSASNIVAAPTIDIGNIAGNFVAVTNSTGATVIGDLNSNYPSGARRKVVFFISGGSITLAQGSHLQLPSAINMPIGTGDMVEFTSFGTGWYVSGYLPYSIATKANMQAGVDIWARVTPALVGQNDGVAKAWVNFTVSGTTPTIQASENVASVVRNGTGDYTITFTTAFSSANYAVSAGPTSSSGRVFVLSSQLAGSYRFTYSTVSSTPGDEPPQVSMTFFGRQ